MPLNIEPIKIQPRQEDKTFEIEVFVTYHESLQPHVFAQVVGSGYTYTSPNARLIERYTFKVTSPFINREQGDAKETN